MTLHIRQAVWSNNTVEVIPKMLDVSGWFGTCTIIIVWSLTVIPKNMVFFRCSNILDTTAEFAYVKLAIVKSSPSDKPLCLATSMFNVSFSARSVYYTTLAVVDDDYVQ